MWRTWKINLQVKKQKLRKICGTMNERRGTDSTWRNIIKKLRGVLVLSHLNKENETENHSDWESLTNIHICCEGNSIKTGSSSSPSNEENGMK